jgi:hypothetical protein
MWSHLCKIKSNKKDWTSSYMYTNIHNYMQKRSGGILLNQSGEVHGPGGGKTVIWVCLCSFWLIIYGHCKNFKWQKSRPNKNTSPSHSCLQFSSQRSPLFLVSALPRCTGTCVYTWYLLFQIEMWPMRHAVLSLFIFPFNSSCLRNNGSFCTVYL